MFHRKWIAEALLWLMMMWFICMALPPDCGLWLLFITLLYCMKKVGRPSLWEGRGEHLYLYFISKPIIERLPCACGLWQTCWTPEKLQLQQLQALQLQRLNQTSKYFVHLIFYIIYSVIEKLAPVLQQHDHKYLPLIHSKPAPALLHLSGTERPDVKID